MQKRLFSYNNKLAELVFLPLKNHQEFLEKVYAWQQEAWGHLHAHQPGYAEKIYRERLNINKLPITYLIFLENRIIGMVSLLRANQDKVGDPNLYQANGLYIIKSLRKQGLGKVIVEMIENAARDFGALQLQIGTVEKTLVNYYQQLGYSVTQENNLYDKYPVWMMVKTL
jgi:GNAT superfamily N-acetyltransferase